MTRSLDGRGGEAGGRILFVINSLEGGGAERVMATLLAASEVRANRHDIALALLDDRPRAFALPRWLKVIQLDCRAGTRPSITAVDRLVGEFQPHVTVSFLTRSNLASGIAMMKRRRPWIISERTSTPAHLGSELRQLGTKAMMRLVYPRASKVIAVSDGVAAKLSRSFGVPQERIDIIPNPVDLPGLEEAATEASPLAIDEPYLIALGRLVKVKNYPLLLRAFAQSGLSCLVVIAGDGPERDSLAKLAADLGIADRLIMPGWLSSPYSALRRASVFALSSDLEGFPNALVEALALGVPSVATNCPHGPAEILAGSSFGAISGLTVGSGGILTPVGDVDSYSNALRLAFDQPLQEQLSAGGRKRASDYSADRIAARYWSVIEAELAQAQARGPTSPGVAEPRGG